MYRKGGYILARIVGLMLVLILGCALAIQFPSVQTSLVRKALARLDNAFDGSVQVGEIKIMPSGVVVLHDAIILDEHPHLPDADTLARIGKLTANFTLKGLLRKEGLHLGRVTVDDGLFFLVNEPSHYKTNLARVFRMSKKEDKEDNHADIFDIRKVVIHNFRYRMHNCRKERKTDRFGIDWFDMDVMVADAKAHSLKFSDGIMSGVLDDMQARERSGFEFVSFKGRAKVGRGKTIVENLRIVDPFSNLDLKYYTMTYDNTKSFKKYLSEVQMEGDFNRSTLALHTLSYFTGSWNGSNTVLDIRNGHMKGFVNDFEVDGLRFTDLTSGTSISNLDASFIGLPAYRDMLMDVDADGIRFTTGKVGSLLANFMGKSLDISKFAKGQNLVLDAVVRGPLDKLDVDARLKTDDGEANITADIRNLIAEERPLSLGVTLATDALNLGDMIGRDDIGNCTMEGKASIVLGADLPEVDLSGLNIQSVSVKGREFNDIRANGTLSDGTLSARLTSGDKAIGLTTSVTADLKSKDGISHYQIDSDLSNLDLHELGIDKRTGTSRIAVKFAGDITMEGEYMRGEVYADSLKVENIDGIKNLGGMEFKAWMDEGKQKFNLSSAFADASFTGDRSIGKFLEDMMDVTVRQELPAIFPVREDNIDAESYDFDIKFHDTKEVLSFVMPGMYVADSTSVTLSMDRGDLNGSISSARLAYGTKYIKDASLDLDNFLHSINATLSGSEISLGGITIQNPDISAFAHANELALGLHFDKFANAGGIGDIYINGQVSRDTSNVMTFDAHPLESFFELGGNTWSLGESRIHVRGSDISVDDFTLTNGDQSILVNGGYSTTHRDSIKVEINDFELDVANHFLQKDFGIAGKLSGTAMLGSEPESPFSMMANLGVSGMKIGGVNAGDVTLTSMTNEGGEDISIYMRDVIDGRNAINLTGLFFPTDKRVDLQANLSQMPIAVAQPFASSIFSKMDGGLSGLLSLSGPLSSLTTESENLELENALIKIAYTGAEYILNGPMRMDEDGLYIDLIDIRDNERGTGSLRGTLSFDHLHDFALDARADINNLKVVDANELGSNGVYGLLRASGNASITGPLSALAINANIRNSGDGNLHIPTSGKLSTEASDLLTFTQPKVEIDPYDEMLGNYKAKIGTKSDMDIQARVSLSPTMRAFVDIDQSSGNAISFSGAGNVALHLRPSNAVFDVNGDYVLNEGSYSFEIPGILKRDFSIVDGSALKFSGNVMDTELDLNAKYTLKASLSNIITDTTSLSTRRTVECGLAITDRLRNPQVAFSINVPDLDPTTKSQVESALNTDDKVQKQFVALLLMNSFIPNEVSGVFNGSNMLVSNVTELMSNQLNSILQKLEIPFNMDIDYQGQSQGTNMFDVAISTQLFNNRVIVGGSVGNRKYKTSTNPNGDMVGDLDIQIKMDPSGKYRLNLFSHSADEHTSFLDFSQRNGFGVSYQKEYNSLKDMIDSIIHSGRKRRERKAQEALPPSERVIEDQQRQQVTISIEDNE